jgi:hypothetical protein
MYITYINERYGFKLVNLRKVLRIAFRAAKKVEGRLFFYYDALELNEEITLETGVLCKIVESFDGMSKSVSDTVRFQVIGTRTPELKPRKKPKFFIGYFDDDGGLEKIAEIHLQRHARRTKC